MSPDRTIRRPLQRQRGMSLVELMVGITIGLMMVAGLALLFGNTGRTANELDKSLRQIESGRYAVDLLGEDLSVAGYFGEAIASGTAATVDPCATSAAVIADLEAKRAAAPAVLPHAVTGLTAQEASALPCLANHLAGTPAVVVRRLDTTAVAVDAITPGFAYLQSSNNEGDINATYVAGTVGSAFVLKDLDGSINKVRRYLSRVYYVAGCSDCGADTIPTLKRAELRGGAVAVAPLAEGIENIGLDYGFDTDSDGVPDQWIGLNGPAGAAESAAASALGWQNVVAVRIHLLSRASTPSPGFSDQRTYALGTAGTAPFTVTPGGDAYKRRAYVTTVRLNSIAGLRE